MLTKSRSSSLARAWKIFWISSAVLVGIGASVLVTFLTRNADALVFFGDWLVLLGLGLSFLVYLLESSAAWQRDLDSVLAMLRGVKDGFSTWGDIYFNPYSTETAADRAGSDFHTVMGGGCQQVIRVPVEPLVALIEQPGESDLIHKATIEAANLALWQTVNFNQLVQQQTDFYTRHLAEIVDTELPPERRTVLARAAGSISMMLHAQGIGEAVWYKDLNAALEENINDLFDTRLPRSPWSLWGPGRARARREP